MNNNLTLSCVLQFIVLTVVLFQIHIQNVFARQDNIRAIIDVISSNDILDINILQNFDYDNEEIVLFKISERELATMYTNDNTRNKITAGRTRVVPNSFSMSSKMKGSSSFKKEFTKKDPRNILFNEHGFTYLGVLSKYLPDFHVIVRNKSIDSSNENYKEYLVEAMNATWILSQSRSIHVLRNSKPKKEYRIDKHSRDARKARMNQRKIFAKQRDETMKEFGKQIRQSALRRTTLLHFDPHGPHGRFRSGSWSTRRLMEVNTELKDSYNEHKFPSDPLVKYQWFLHGGSYEYRPRKIKQIPIPNAFYLDVIPVWNEPTNVDGSGIVISVIDDGVNFLHSDLNDKFVPMLSVDITDTLMYSSILSDQSAEKRDETIKFFRQQVKHGFPFVGQSHGTSVASIAVGSPSDGTCGTGVAPGALFSSIRLFGMQQFDSHSSNEYYMLTELQEAVALSYKCVNKDSITGEHKLENMIYLLSWGLESKDMKAPVRSSHVVETAINRCIEYGRRGLGSIYVMPSGNKKLLLSSIDFDGYANLRYTIAVGSTSLYGYPLSYSEGGESLLVVAPSNDGVRGITAATNVGSFYNPRMETIVNELNEDMMDINNHDNAKVSMSTTGCTNSFGGTSASVPMIGGVVAMMLQANPKLSWKDVQDILIRSCQKPHYEKIIKEENAIDESHRIYKEWLPIQIAQDKNDDLFFESSESHNGGYGDEHDEQLDRGLDILNHIKSTLYIFYKPLNLLEWIENTETNLHHSRLLGFGIPNVTTAVLMSKNRKNYFYNDYEIRTHNIIENMVDYDFNSLDRSMTISKNKENEYIENAKTGKYYKTSEIVEGQNMVVWHVKLDKTRHPIKKLYDNDEEVKKENFVIEHVDLYINASYSSSIMNTQIALCDRSSLCSLFVTGSNYYDTNTVDQQIEYTFSTVKFWGQKKPYEGDWVVMMKNNFPNRFGGVLIQNIVLTIHGHCE